MTSPIITLPARRGLTAAQVFELQTHRGYPSVSVLLTTTPAPRMTARDRTTLDALVAQAVARLATEPQPVAPEVAAALHDMATAAAGDATTHGLALYASEHRSDRVPLPVGVRDRVVVDPTFATRDLVRALHRTPRHLVLLLSSRDARLFEGGGGALRPVVGSGFPMRRVPADDTRVRAGDPAEDPFLRRVHQALATYQQLRPAPVVLVGAQRILAAFSERADSSRRLAGSVVAGRVPVNLQAARLAELAERTASVLTEHLRSRRSEALALLEKRVGQDRVAAGLAAAWQAARHGRPEMLAVEEGLFQPVRLRDGGDVLEPATDVEHPDVVDDIVDELIEAVLIRGGWVALMPDESLVTHGGVALTLRRE
ncbi:MAG: hypothetical protein ACFCVG_03140 [Kineosporiaceae bacterium]